jgi:hypothetical protein
MYPKEMKMAKRASLAPHKVYLIGDVGGHITSVFNGLIV